MKCKKHPYELGVGVCASCLRERLLDLIAAQNELPAEHHLHRPDPSPQLLPPLVFPRSVSPYVSHRRSVGSDASAAYGRRYNHRFFTTPQVGPTFDAAADGFSGDADGGRRRISGRFSVFSILFRHQRSGEAESDLGSSKRSGSGSWFSALIRRRRKKKSRSFSAEEAAATGRSQASDRGMSPVIDDDDADGCSSGYSTESSSGWRRPTPTPMRRFPASSFHRYGGRAGISSFAVCLSPLIRVGHNSWRGQPAESGTMSGELRSTASPHRCRHRSAGGVSLGPNRSRKLAGLGRFD
ncbi:hypothetical protein COCNU_09G004030 [Cocos nucifera]|uniref:Uncharacterized protein n=1 Tax=Cocos nucifera TaxID=13894 RepID=A0A8K0IL72_COCNU|nr:hypothetical protein COCNU_09G004030 [Cocos nucifera]